ncbi:MAG: fibronectin type III domain-containing protein [Fulvivirga sp.]
MEGRIIILSTLFFLMTHVSLAQTYPVSASTQIIPPYSTYLAGYVAPGSNKLAVNIFLGDINRADIQVRLRLRIEGQGILIETKPEYLPAPMTLQGGVPERLIASDLEQYFRPENLNFQGITKQQFQQTGQLPEGLYQFCFEVLEYNRGVRISNSACTMAWLILNDPPIINLPRNNEKLRAQSPQYITFQWTPRHTGSPNSAFATEYEFSLVELWPETRNPNDAILTTPPIFETTTASTTLIYGPAEPQLEPGRHYAFRVKAKSISGVDELDLFKNQGYSQTHKFIYGDACNIPDGVEIVAKSSSRFVLNWEGNFNNTDYTVRYRIASDSDSDWTEENTFFEEFEVSGLNPGTTYEYQIGAGCGPFSAGYTALASITTDEPKETDFACGTEVVDFDLDNKELLNSLQSGQYIYAGDFDIKIEEVSGSNGIFSGSGKAELPFLNYVKVRTTFENIKVNTDYRMIEGNVYTVWDPNSRSMIDLPSNDDELDESEGGDEEGESDTNPGDSVVNVDSPIDTVYQEDNGDITVITEDGDTITVANGDEVIITDNNGNSTTIPPPGGFTTGGNNGSTDGTGSGNGSNDQSGASDSTFIADADLNFGPISVKFAESPQSTGTDDEGYCSFENVPVSFILSLEGQHDISKQIQIDDATVSFKKKCEGDEYKEVAFNWSNADGVDIGTIKYISAKIKALELFVNSEGELSGDIDLHAFLNEDQSLGNLAVIKKGVNGDFGFSYNNTKLFKGVFDFSGISGINIDLIKSDKTIAQITDGSLDADGVFTGTTSVSPVSYQSEGLTVSVKSMSADISLSMQSGFELISGDAEFVISDIQGIDGDLGVNLNFNEGIVNSELKSNNLSGYGFTISDTYLQATFNEQLDIDEISGSFAVKHGQFNSKLSVNQFEVKDGVLNKFNGNGELIYNDYAVNITNTSYNATDDLIIIDAIIEVEENGVKVAASIEDFTIDREGNITFGGYEANVSGTRAFGPLVIALKAEATKVGNYEGKFKQYEAEASFYLKVKNSKGFDKEVAIADAHVSFVKHKNNDEYKNISVSVEGVNIPLGKIGLVEGTIKGASIEIETDAEYLTGNVNDENTAYISDESYLDLQASLTENQSISDIIILKKGLEGNFRFNFDRSESYIGDFDFNGINKINIDLKKNNTVLASLKNGSIDSAGKLKGKIKSIEGASFKSGAFDVGISNLDVDVEMALAEGVESFKILSGKGAATVSNIQSVDGQVKLLLDYGVDGNFSADVDNQNTSLTAFGMSLTDLNLLADFNEKFELNKIEGSLKASDERFSAKLDVDEFLLQEGELKTLKVNGVVDYKGFKFELLESTYADAALDISAKVEIENAGKLRVDKFQISKDGEISIGKIAGNLNKPMITMTFDATFKDNGFKGEFNGDVKFVKLDGALDFGSEANYNYAYLRMAAGTRAGIPLGPTGLKLNKVGGQLGYNYYLNFTSGSYSGGPKKGNYLLGLTLGISDVANMFSAEGTSIVQFGGDRFELNLLGNIKAPQTNPIIDSDFNVNYYLPDNTVDGSLNADINIPSSTGFVFETTTPASINFAMAEENWNVEGGVQAAMFREITFTGNTSLSKSGESIAGYLRGQASYSYQKTFNYDWTAADVNGSLQLGFNSQINAQLNQSGISGSMGVHIYGNGNLSVTTILGTKTGSVSLDCQAQVSYENNQGKLRGEANIAVQSSLVDFEHSFEIEKTF